MAITRDCFPMLGALQLDKTREYRGIEFEGGEGGMDAYFSSYNLARDTTRKIEAGDWTRTSRRMSLVKPLIKKEWHRITSRSY